MTDENTALHKAEAEIVELRLALMNTEACRAEAEKQMHTAESERNKLRVELATTRIERDAALVALQVATGKAVTK